VNSFDSSSLRRHLAGSYGKGLWRLKDDESKLFTIAEGLSSDQIRSLSQDEDGTLWIGTFGGGLNRWRGGQFVHYTRRKGCLSDNISHVEDDGHGSLWLSTTRGICRIEKRQLEEFTAGNAPQLIAGELRRRGRLTQRPVRA